MLFESKLDLELVSLTYLMSFHRLWEIVARGNDLDVADSVGAIITDPVHHKLPTTVVLTLGIAFPPLLRAVRCNEAQLRRGVFCQVATWPVSRRQSGEADKRATATLVAGWG